MVRIPVEYQEVEYLESSGTQWIDTGVYIANGQVNYRVVVDSVFVSIIKTQTNILFGNGFTGGTWFGASTTEKLTIGGNIYFTESPFTRSIKTAVFDGTKITVTVGDETFSRKGSVAGNLYLFEYTNRYPSMARIYSEEVYDSNTLVQHLIPCYRKSDSEPGMYDTVSGTFFTNAGTGTFIVGNDVSWDTASLIERRRQILLNTPHLETISDSIASFKTDVPANLKDCKIHFTPIQEGSGDPSPDNVRPITGWNGVTVTRCGKNLAHFDQEEMVSTGWNRAFPNPFKKAGRYTISCQNEIVNGSMKGALFVLANNVAANPFKALTTWAFGDSTSGQMERVIDVSEGDTKYNCIVLRFNAPPSYQSIINAQIQIEENSSVTDYEPYTGTSLTISFPQTIYGGYVDIKDGEVKLVVNRQCVTKALSDAASSAVSEAVDGYFWDASKPFFDYSPTTASSYSNKISNMLPYSYSGSSNINPHFYANAGGHVYAYVPHGTDATTEIQICVPLATPIEYTLDPVTLTILKGINNIWSNANGNIEVRFWKH